MSDSKNNPNKTSQTNTPLSYKLLSMLFVTRGYNIAILVIAQYLASIFIFSPQKTLRGILLDRNLFITVLASSIVIAAGYIINSFYDYELDKINKPLKLKMDSFVSQSTKLKFYFFLNTLGFLLAFMVSWRAAVFFAVYIFAIWFYSHKLKKYPFTGLLASSILVMLPFFAVFVYHKNFSEIAFVHASFLFCIISIRELVKDLEGVKGAFVNNYKTIPVKYGEIVTKKIILGFIGASFVPIVFLLNYPEIGEMRYYFYVVVVVFLCIPFYLWPSKSVKDYNIIHNILKLMIVIGVFSLALIDTSVLKQNILQR